MLTTGQNYLNLAGGKSISYLGTNNIYVGNALLAPSWFTTNVTVKIVKYVTVPVVDWLQQKYGEVQIPEVNITYLFDQNQTPSNLSDDLVTLVEPLFLNISLFL